jgi:hypothetical protein
VGSKAHAIAGYEHLDTIWAETAVSTVRVTLGSSHLRAGIFSVFGFIYFSTAKVSKRASERKRIEKEIITKSSGCVNPLIAVEKNQAQEKVNAIFHCKSSLALFRRISKLFASNFFSSSPSLIFEPLF